MRTLYIKQKDLLLTSVDQAAGKLGLDRYDARYSANNGHSMRKIWEHLDKKYVYLYGFKDVQTIEGLRFDYQSKSHLNKAWFDQNTYFSEGVFITSKDEDPGTDIFNEGMTTEEFKEIVYNLVGTNNPTDKMLSNVRVITTSYGKLTLYVVS